MSRPIKIEKHFSRMHPLRDRDQPKCYCASEQFFINSNGCEKDQLFNKVFHFVKNKETFCIVIEF